jgi:hypothetical protein
MLKHKNIICFWHQNDKYTLTSNGFIWTNFKEKIDLKSIIVLKDKDAPPKMSYGICTDFPLNYL